MHNNEVAEGSKLPQMQSEITYSNNSSSEFIKLSDSALIEPELFLFIDCSYVLGDSCPFVGESGNDTYF